VRALAIVSSRLQKLGLKEIEAEFDQIIVLDLGELRFRDRFRMFPLLVRGANPRVLILGDIYSRVGQAFTILSRVTSLIVLEDGADSHRALSLWGTGRQLKRAHQTKEFHLLEVAFHRKFNRLSRSGKVEWVFAGTPLFSAPSAKVRRHNFAALKKKDSDLRSTGNHKVVLGSALAADGFISSSAYIHWLQRVCDAGSIIYPHRRDLSVACEFARRSEVEICVLEGCIEAAAVRWRDPVEVLALPTSCFLTLPFILPASSRIIGFRIPDHWWTDRATDELKQLSESLLAKANEIVELI